VVFNWRKEKIFQKMFISWKLINGLKKIEKKKFSLWVKLKEKRVFPQSKKLFKSPVNLY